ncbi:MAG: ElyC/SanA/YdcF family protein [Candidatus Gracilibacteria bacterium]|nr:ElyC/SanA/YdcF family protein [Candidatus Gracilibacteria bacterium]
MNNLYEDDLMAIREIKDPMKNSNSPVSKIVILIIFIFIVYSSFVPVFIFQAAFDKIIYKPAEADDVDRIGIVFGAGIKEDGSPSDVLKDRLKSAMELFYSNKISKILVSGDNRFENYNEPESMKSYLINNGISEDNIIVDYAGRRTYDTCVRAKEVFKVDKAILITQDFHLPRALFTCNALGIESIGYSATKQDYVKRDLFAMREFAAIHKAVFDVYGWGPNYIK